MRIAENVSSEEAATMSASAITCGQGVFQKLKTNQPNNHIQKKENILIYGGSSSAGTVAIQYANL
jgi:NADPH:quinone reductase-like Zn-dependent oxidoreductase